MQEEIVAVYYQQEDVDVMDEIVYEALNKYYHVLELKGYMNISHGLKLLVLSFFKDYIYQDYRGLISKEDYRLIENALECIYGTSCLIPYPDYLKMGKLHLGQITELTQRIEALENTSVVKVIHDIDTAEGTSDIVIAEEDED